MPLPPAAAAAAAAPGPGPSRSRRDTDNLTPGVSQPSLVAGPPGFVTRADVRRALAVGARPPTVREDSEKTQRRLREDSEKTERRRVKPAVTASLNSPSEPPRV